MNKDMIRPKLKILMIIVVALTISSISTKTIFLGATPRINKIFLARTISFPGIVVNKTQNYLASLFVPHPTPSVSTPEIAFTQPQALQKTVLQQFQFLPTNALNKVAQGVYAKEDSETNTVYIRLTKDIQWETRTIDWNGKKIQALFPKK